MNEFRFTNPMHNLAYAIRTAAVLTALPSLAQSGDWRTRTRARGIEHDLVLAAEAGDDGGIYRLHAMRRVIELGAQLRR